MNLINIANNKDVRNDILLYLCINSVFLFVQILLQVWPNVNHYARTLLKETIEPAVAESLSNYKLNGFKFERMILGTIVSGEFICWCMSLIMLEIRSLF